MFNDFLKRHSFAALILFILFSMAVADHLKTGARYTVIPYSQFKAEISKGSF